MWCPDPDSPIKPITLLIFYLLCLRIKHRLGFVKSLMQIRHKIDDLLDVSKVFMPDTVFKSEIT